MRPLAGLLVLALATACGRFPRQVESAPAPRPTVEHLTEAQCLDLRDHSINVFADEYLAEHGDDLSPEELVAFREGWAEELVKSGAMDKFDRFCKRITIDEAACAMRASTPDGLVFCMRAP